MTMRRQRTIPGWLAREDLSIQFNYRYVHERSTAREKAIISGEERYRGEPLLIRIGRPVGSRTSVAGDSQGVKNRGPEIVGTRRIPGRIGRPAIRCGVT